MLASGVSTTDSYLQFMTVLFLFVVVLAITYATTKWIANYQKGKAVCGNIEVIETSRIASNKYIQIIRIGSKYLAIAVGKDEVHMLTELSEEELIWKETQKAEIDFASVLQKFKRHGGKEND